MSQLTGIALIRVDGELLQTEPGAKLKLGGEKRDARTGHRVYGYSESIEAAELDATIFHSAKTPVSKIRGWTEAIIQFETDTGVTYQVSNAWTAETPELTDGEGKLTLKMMGDPAEEL